MTKVCLLDTNIISNTIKKDQNIHDSIYNLIKNGYKLAIPFLSVVEMNDKNELLQKFISIFSKLKILILKPYNQILKLELEKLPNPILFEEIIMDEVNSNLYAIDITLEKVFSTSTFIQSARNLKEEQKQAAISIQTMIQSEKESEESIFIDFYMWSQLRIRFPIEFKSMIDNNEIDKIYSLKSLLIQAQFIYYKYIKKGMKPENSDPFDLLIISNIPYVDLFITERTNASLLREIRSKIIVNKEFDIKTMKDIRK